MSFSEILGQEKAIHFLKKVIARDRIPHAYLFTGISGIGKTSTAKMLAMALNCRERNEGDSCGRCPTCRQVQDGNAPDFLILEADGQNIKIDQVRELNRSLGYAPIAGRYRVTVINQSETMTAEASNSFLKTLEEPPQGNIFILNTTEPLDLLQTIVSRCQKVPFRPLPSALIARELMARKGMDEESAMILANISGGSLGKALKMSEKDFLDRRQQWLFKVISIPGIENGRVLELALECAEEEKKGLERADTTEGGMMDMLGIWKSWYRDLLLMKIEAPVPLLMNSDFSHKLKNIARSFTMEQVSESLLLIDEAQRDIKKNRNMTLVMEHMVLGLKHLAHRQS